MFWQMNPQYMIHMTMIKNGVYPMRIENLENYVKKTWGFELWFANTAEYCGKLLVVEHGKWSSEGKFHYHEIKDAK